MMEPFKKLVEKEIELIKRPIQEFFEDKLLKDFKNKKGQSVIEIRRLLIIPYIDEDMSNFREEIVITRVDARADVFVDTGNGSSSNNLAISIYKSFSVKYNGEGKEYFIENKDDIMLVDSSQY